MPYYQEFKAPTADQARDAAVDYIKTLPFVAEPRLERVSYVLHPNGRGEWVAVVMHYGCN